MYTAILTAFCNQMCFSVAQLARAESPQVLLLSKRQPVGCLKTLTVEQLVSLCGVFKDSLSVMIGEENAPLVEVVHGVIKGDAIRGLELVKNLADEQLVKVEIKIDKQKIVERLRGDRGKFRTVFYFFSENVLSLLQAPLTTLDTALFEDAYTPTVIVVSDRDAQLSGSFLCILGEKQFQEQVFSLIQAGQVVRRQVDRFREFSSENTVWIHFQLKNITPRHFICAQQMPGSEDMAALVTSHLFTATILFTANRSVLNDDGFECTYSSSEQAVKLFIEKERIYPGDNQALARAALWPYHGKDSDRLVIFQNEVARRIEPEDPGSNLDSLIRQLETILANARWHYKAFVDGQIIKHFDQVEEVARFVSGTAREIGAVIDTVTKGLIEAMLAAIGVVVFTIFTSLLDNKISRDIFMIATKAYAVYLLIFQIAFRMGSIAHSFTLLRSETRDQTRLFARQLGEQQISVLVRPIHRRNVQFSVWFVLSFLICAGIAISLLFFSGPLYEALLGGK